MSETHYHHWHLEVDVDHIMWLTLDREGASVNTINAEVLEEFDRIVSDLMQRQLRGVVLLSGKQRGFIAGADISQFTTLKTEQEAFDRVRHAQSVLDRWAQWSVPTVAMITGFCLGGGLELALSCRYRIVDDEPGTRLGLPEVKLGLLPGWGGTVRLPQLIGAPKAMRVMLSGRLLSPVAARRLGIVDAVLPARQLRQAACHYLLDLPPPRVAALTERWTNTALFRPLLGRLFSRKLAAVVQKKHYPAPYIIIKNWLRGGNHAHKMEREARSIAELMFTPTAQHLIRVFFLKNRLKRLIKGPPLPLQRVHVIGAGTMGSDIAAWCALKGCQVTLQDQTQAQLAAAMQRALRLFKRKLKMPRLINAAMDRLQPDLSGGGVASADWVIEAIFERLEHKQALLKQIEPMLKADAILASNTSSIPLEAMAAALQDPSRLLGLHFFNPVPLMPLVEVIHQDQTREDNVETALRFVGMLDRLPIPVASRPGFLVNRILMPYLMEAIILLEEKVSPRAVDQAAVDFGMPMGPMTLMDKVGLDVCLSVAENLAERLGGVVPSALKERVEQGYLGLKSGQGFYRYKGNKPIVSRGMQRSTQAAVSEITDRLILPMVNTAVACCSESLVDDADLLDAAMVFGTGFAPFRGGLMQYADDRGYADIHAQLSRFATQYGERFQPVASELWGESD